MAELTEVTPLSDEELARIRDENKVTHGYGRTSHLLATIDALTERLHTVERERDAAKLNTRRMALLAEMFVYGSCTEGGLMAQVHRALTDQDVEYEGPAEEGR